MPLPAANMPLRGPTRAGVISNGATLAAVLATAATSRFGFAALRDEYREDRVGGAVASQDTPRGQLGVDGASIDALGDRAAIWARQSAEHRRKTEHFVSTCAIVAAPTLHVVCQPLARLMESYLALGGIRWAEQRWRAVGAASATG